MSSFLILSDTHLNKHFDTALYNQLRALIDEHDVIILNGDFWDVYQTSFDKFAKSKWKDLFPLLKEKKAIYLQGNHDPFKDSDQRISQFSAVQKDSFEFKSGNKTFHVEHGHVIGPAFGQNHTTLTKAGKWAYPFLHYLYEYNIPLISKIYRWYINVLRSRVIELFEEYVAEQNKFSPNKSRSKKTYIFGHAHKLMHDKKSGYAISGEWLPHFGGYIVVKNGILSTHEVTF